MLTLDNGGVSSSLNYFCMTPQTPVREFLNPAPLALFWDPLLTTMSIPLSVPTSTCLSYLPLFPSIPASSQTNTADKQASSQEHSQGKISYKNIKQRAQMKGFYSFLIL